MLETVKLPTDKVMAEMLEIQLGLKPTNDVITNVGNGFEFENPEAPGYARIIDDPRTNESAALRLLHWMMFGDDIPLVIRPVKSGWEVCDEDTDDPWCIIPISGIAFCESVCKLAARVTGR